MNIQNDVQTLLQKKMDRREFIKHVGVGFAAILGVSAVLRTMSTLGGNQKSGSVYNSGVYGGVKSSQGSKQS